jgi:hypothetical protein
MSSASANEPATPQDQEARRAAARSEADDILWSIARELPKPHPLQANSRRRSMTRSDALGSRTICRTGGNDSSTRRGPDPSGHRSRPVPSAAVQRFVLELPDGELEVIGTHFGVRVDPQGTRRVEVTEGRVALRLRDALPISLGAGESWTAEREAARAAAPPSLPAAEPPPTPAPAAAAPSERSLARARQTALPETKRALESPSGEQAATGGTHDDDFARGMAAFGAGDYGQAERLFQDVERRHAENARRDDSTFLRAVARARRGDAEGARATARQYLERYPNGLRAPEAERLARPREAAESPKGER